VPISTLVEILGNILAPTTLLLGEMLVQRFVTEKTSDASAPSQGGPTQGPTLEEEMLQSLLMSSSIKNKDKGGGSGATTNPTSVDSAPPLGDKEGVHDEDMVELATLVPELRGKASEFEPDQPKPMTVVIAEEQRLRVSDRLSKRELIDAVRVELGCAKRTAERWVKRAVDEGLIDV